MAKEKQRRPVVLQDGTDGDSLNRDTPIEPQDELVGSPESDPVHRAYARTGEQDTTGISGMPANDEDAGAERKKLYKKGAKLVSRID